MCELNSRLGIHRPRTKFLDVQKANLTYRKQRKHSRSQTRKITRRLIDLLGKILKEIREIERGNENAENLLTVSVKSDLEIITRMYRQQKNHFRNNDSRESIPNWIVSLSKPHLRPIVRGKEVKSVEFGAKVNNILFDWISFIEKLSFNAFNEGTRLVHCLKMHKRLFGVEAKRSEETLATRELKTETTARRTKILCIFFGIHTANVVRLADRMEQRERLAAA